MSPSSHTFRIVTLMLVGVAMYIAPAYGATFTPNAHNAQSAARIRIAHALRRGSRGQDVLTLQRMLAADHSIYPEGAITGYYGTLTEAAVKRFQEKHHIVASGDAASTGYGLVGPKTLAVLQQALDALPSASSSDMFAPDGSPVSPEEYRAMKWKVEHGLLPTASGTDLQRDQ